MIDLLDSVATSFATDYAAAREKFQQRCAAAGAAPRRFDNPLPGPDGGDLSTDVAWIGREDADAVLVVISATHGAEGFCGSGIQCDWLADGWPARLPDRVAVLLVHAINPHGFSWLRRVTAEGVDLNRNFIDFSKPLPENPGYVALADALLPAALSGPVHEAARARIEAYRLEHSDAALQLARSGGQYSHPQGLFFGGTGPTWSRQVHESLIRDYRLADRRLVAGVDLHTGLGPFGYGEPICHHRKDGPGLERAFAWYGPSVTASALGTTHSYARNGLTTSGYERVLGDRLTFITLEFGTYPSPQVHAALAADHWLHAFGHPDWRSEETQTIKRALRRVFYPDTDDWREMVLYRGRQILRQATLGLAATR